MEDTIEQNITEAPMQPIPVFQLPVQRKASITTGVVERQEAPPEIQLLLNDSQIYEKVRENCSRYKVAVVNG